MLTPLNRADDSERGVGFAAVSQVMETGPGRYEAELGPQWTIGGRPHGGYLLALAGRAAVASGQRPHVIEANAHFVRVAELGVVTIETELLRAGRTASTVRVRILQAGDVCVEAVVTTGELDDATKPYWDKGLPPIGTVPFEECRRRVMRPADGMAVALTEHVDIRYEPDSAGFMAGAPRGLGELRGWIALPVGESFDTLSLLFAVDGLPPATFDIEYAGWVPTLALSAYVRALPAPGPVRVLHKAQLIDARRVDETCFVWDAAGRLVAQGTQLAAIRLG